MSRIRPILVLSVSLLTATASFAQKPTSPGPPSSQPKVVVDSTGTTVGEAVDLLNGQAKAYVKYTLANGDTTMLTATATDLAGATLISGSGINGIPNLFNVKVLFTSSNCSGDAYVYYGSVAGSTQLTNLQSITLAGAIPNQGPPPVPNPACPPPVGEEWLYTAPTSNFLCPAMTDPVHTLTFNSYYGPPSILSTPVGAQCSALTAPLTFGGNNPNFQQVFAQFVVFSPAENLSLRYKAPYSVK